MPYTYTLTTVIPASAQAIYDAWLDSIGHSEMTGSAAEMSDEIGADISAWDGYISGRNLELVPAERIVQSWRTTKFEDDQEDSIVTVLLEEGDDGTLLTLVHSNVPEDHRSYEEGGWQSNYFEPMQAYFASLEPEEEVETGPEEAPAPMAERMPQSAPAAMSAPPKARRASGKKAKAAAPKSKASPAKKRSKRAAATKSKRKPPKKSAKPTKKKATKRTAAKRPASKKSASKKTATKRKASRRKK